MSFIFTLIMFNFFLVYIFFFKFKVLVLLSLESIFVVLVVASCYSMSGNWSLICLLLMSIFMVLDSVMGLSLLLACSRSGSFSSLMVKHI